MSEGDVLTLDLIRLVALWVPAPIALEGESIEPVPMPAALGE